MKTFQDFEKATNKETFILDAISEYKGSPMYRVARDADEYDHQRNSTILNFVKTILSSTGVPMVDTTASNNKITSNFFHRLNTQRCTYSLGNGVTFPKDAVKKKLGEEFDTRLKKAGYFALIHGVAYCFWNVDKLHVFKATEFVPLLDESSGALMAGVRFWQLAPDKPMYAVLYEMDGYTKYSRNDGKSLITEQDKRAYREKTRYSVADGEEVIGEENYSSLPIVPLRGSDLRQSTLVGMKSGIDSYDLIRSGFANDLTDVSQIYWIIDNAGGMTEEDKARFRQDLLYRHLATTDADAGVKVTPYTQEVPYQARKEYLDGIRAGIYEDFGGLDVHTIAAGATNDHIDAAYQPMDENADDFEYQVIECVQQLLALQGITGEDATPVFKRNRISNQKEQVEIVMLEAPYLNDETILNKLPNISPDEVETILAEKAAEDSSRLGEDSGVNDDGGFGTPTDR